MVSITFDLFILSCAWLLLWGMLKPDRVLQYPFFMGGIITAFLVPQAIALIDNPGVAPPSSLARIFFYGSLCTLMCYAGYVIPPRERWLARLDANVNPQRLFYAGVFLTAFGIACGLATRQFATSGRWTGPATILYFLAGTAWPGIAILLLYGLYWRRLHSLALASLGLFNILPAVVDAGRRQTTATLIILVGLGFFFARRIKPPRLIALALVLLTAFLIPVIAGMRGNFWDAFFTGTLTIQDFTQAFDRLQTGQTLEFRNAALIAEGAEITGQYGYGTGFWNRIVFQYVPAQWFGTAFKESLYIRLSNISLQELFNYTRPSGTTTTGFGDTFQEFGYFGCILFGLIGYWFRYLWIAAVYRSSVYSQVLYMGLVSSALVGVTHGIGRFINEAIFQLLCIALVIRVSREKEGTYSLSPNYVSEEYTSKEI